MSVHKLCIFSGDFSRGCTSYLEHKDKYGEPSAGKTGKEVRMNEPYGEGLAPHTGPLVGRIRFFNRSSTRGLVLGLFR